MALLSLSALLCAEGSPGDSPPPTGEQQPGALSAQARSTTEDEGVLGASESGADTPPGMVVAYQVGAFKARANAERLVASLAKADFVGYLYRKKVGDAIYWTVLVSASNIPFENRADELSKVGFASFPVSKSALDAEFELVAGQ